MDNWNYKGDFLKQFPLNYRGTIGDQFCRHIREGAATPELLFAVLRRAAQRNPTEVRMLMTAKGVLESPEAREFAEFLIAREALPFEERHRRKVEAQAENDYARQVMRQKEPTEKQLALLQKLSCPTKPQNRLEASELIDEYLKK